jgi:hypothetical protein
MPPEGMVHALEIIHSLLKPDGTLIDIHPSGKPPTIELVQDRGRTLVGHLQESDDFIEYRQAQAALEQAHRLGWFDIERSGVFQFVVWSPSIGELRAYLDENWSDAVVAPGIDQRVDGLIKSAQANHSEGATSVEMTETVSIARFKRKD